MNSRAPKVPTSRPTPTLKWALGVETIIGYILVPFYVVLSFLIPKRCSESASKKTHAPSVGQRFLRGAKSIYFTWIKSVGVATGTGALVGAAEWGLARLLNRRLLDGVPAVLTGVGIPALIGSQLVDSKNRLRGAVIAMGATLPRILLNKSWRRDLSTDEEFEQQANTAREQLFSVLNEDSKHKRSKSI